MTLLSVCVIVDTPRMALMTTCTSYVKMVFAFSNPSVYVWKWHLGLFFIYFSVCLQLRASVLQNYYLCSDRNALNVIDRNVHS